MRISDWSSDVCSSDLRPHRRWCPLAREPLLLRLRAEVAGLVSRTSRLADDEAVRRPVFPHISARDMEPASLGRGQRYAAYIGKIGRASCRERVCQYV